MNRTHQNSPLYFEVRIYRIAHHFVGVVEVIYVEQVSPPGVLALVLLHSGLAPQRPVTPVLDQRYVHHQDQHVRRRQPETPEMTYRYSVLSF